MALVSKTFRVGSISEINDFLRLAKFHKGHILPKETRTHEKTRMDSAKVSVSVEIPDDHAISFVAVIGGDRIPGERELL